MNSIKNYFLAICTMLIFILSGCTDSSTQSDNTNDVNLSVSEGPTQENVTSSSEDYNITAYVDSSADLLYDYTSIDQLYSDSTFVFTGKVLNKESYIDEVGMVFTKYTFKISDLLSGKYDSDKITVTCVGGIVLLKDYNAIIDTTKSFEPETTEPIDDSGYLEYKINNVPLLDLNSEYTIFIDSYLENGETIFYPVGTYQGIFSLNSKDNTYLQLSSSTSLIAPLTIKELKDDIK